MSVIFRFCAAFSFSLAITLELLWFIRKQNEKQHDDN